MNDLEFAEAIDALLWISSSGEMRENEANLEAVRSLLQERRQALDHLEALMTALLPLRPWREHERLGSIMLEVLLFQQELAGGSFLHRIFTEESN